MPVIYIKYKSKIKPKSKTRQIKRKPSVYYYNEPVYINPKSRGKVIVKRLKKAQATVRRNIRPKPLGIDYSNFKYRPLG